MERIERRHERSIRVDPNEVTHSALRNEPRYLIGRVTVRIDKQAAVSLADIFNKEVHEQGGLAHPAHAFDVDVLCRVEEDLLTRYGVRTDGDLHGCSPRPRPHQDVDYTARERGVRRNAGVSSPADFAAIPMSLAT